ncbi:sugar carrier protein C-like protein [Tanacetum coccineum]
MAGGGILTGPVNKAYPGNLTLYVTFTCVVAAMGDLIFGYDIGISGGVTSMDPFLKKFFPSVFRKQSEDTSTNQYCKFDSQTLTMFTSSLYLAALLSSLVASTVTRTLGRKLSMLFGGILFCAGALINGFSQAIWMLIVGRILLGFRIRFAIIDHIGIVVANVLNYFFNKLHGNLGWRLVSGGSGPCLHAFITVGSLILPETPNSMIERGKQDEAKTSDSGTFVGQVKEVKVLIPKESTSMATSSRTMPDYLQGGPKMKSSYSNSPQSSVQFNKKEKSLKRVRTGILADEFSM